MTLSKSSIDRGSGSGGGAAATGRAAAAAFSAMVACAVEMAAMVSGCVESTDVAISSSREVAASSLSNRVVSGCPMLYLEAIVMNCAR